MSWGEDQGSAANRATMGIVGLRRKLRRTFEQLFIDNYEQIREIVTNFSEPGVAAVAIDAAESRIVSSTWIEAKAGRPSTAIVGRHSMAEVYVPGDPSVSLRHLAVIAEPVSDWDKELSYILLDLRTGEGFEDEHGRRMTGLRVEGPAFIRCGSYALFFLMTGERIEWPQRALDSWQCLPARVYLEEQIADGTGSRGYSARVAEKRKRMASAGGEVGRRTFLQQTHGPMTVDHDLLREDETPIGELRVRTASRASTFSVGAAAGREGILLGRYERCERAGVLTDARISRVHALIIEISGSLWVIDIASTCGTWRINEDERLVESRVTKLEHRTKVILADRVAELRWKLPRAR